MKEEKRRFSRIIFKVAARIQVGDGLYTVDQLENLSIGGCMVELDTSLELGAVCRIRIVLQPDDPDMDIVVDGKIVRVSGRRQSIQFLSIDPESLFHLHNILRYNAVDPDTIEDEIARHPGLV